MQAELSARGQGSNTLRVCHASSLEGAEAGPETLRGWAQGKYTKGLSCKKSRNGLQEVLRGELGGLQLCQLSQLFEVILVQGKGCHNEIVR